MSILLVKIFWLGLATTLVAGFCFLATAGIPLEKVAVSKIIPKDVYLR